LPSIARESAPTDVITEAKRSEAEAFQIALQTDTPDALKTYLLDYPDSPNGDAALGALARLKLAEFGEWTLYEVGNQRFPQYLRLSSVREIGQKVVFENRLLVDPSIPGKTFPFPSYAQNITVIDCKEGATAVAETTVMTTSGETVYHYKWADPEYLDLSIGQKLAPGTVIAAAQNLLCNERLRTPLVAKTELDKMRFESLASTVSGDGDIFYAVMRNELEAHGQIGVRIVIKLHEDHNLSEVLTKGTVLPSEMLFRTVVERAVVQCAANQMTIPKMEYYNSESRMVYVLAADASKEKQWFALQTGSPFGLLHRIVCNSNEVIK